MEENEKLVTVENLKTFRTQFESKTGSNTVYLTQSEYDTLVAQNKVLDNVEYNIYEDDN